MRQALQLFAMTFIPSIFHVVCGMTFCLGIYSKTVSLFLDLLEPGFVFNCQLVIEEAKGPKNIFS